MEPRCVVIKDLDMSKGAGKHITLEYKGERVQIGHVGKRNLCKWCGMPFEYEPPRKEHFSSGYKGYEEKGCCSWPCWLNFVKAEKTKAFKRKNGKKQCSMCKNWYEEKMFAKDKKFYDKKRPICRDCQVGVARYSTYYKKLTVAEKPVLAEDGYSLTVLCTYCGKRFIPSIKEVQKRLGCLKGWSQGEGRLYCSQGCKLSCPTYRKKTRVGTYKRATSREVPAILRQLVLKRDNYTCQYCGAKIEDATLHVHHIQPAISEPMLQADPDNCTTLCKACHKKVHKSVAGCGYAELRCAG